jgi:hypothetical protein
MKIFRALSIAYGVVVGLAIAWAWWTDIGALGSPREHLLPDIALSILTMPWSLAPSPLHDNWPGVFPDAFDQLAWLTLCGCLQAVVFLLASRGERVARKHGA